MTEDEFKDQVIDLARLRRWRVSHFRPAWTQKGWRTPVQGDKGFPDLVLARNGYVLFVELKSDKGRLSADQILWQQVLPNFEVWRPRDLDYIQGVLLHGGR